MKRQYGGQAYEELSPEKLLQMGKAKMARVLCAYETNLPGSAAERLRMRTDLEAMINQLEVESHVAARAELGACRQTLAGAVAKLRRALGSRPGRREGAAESRAWEVLRLGEAELAARAGEEVEGSSEAKQGSGCAPPEGVDGSGGAGREVWGRWQWGR